jgi:hypothetical protein
MSDQAGGGDEATSDPWIGTVNSMSAFLAGFSLASVVVITDGFEHFRWPGVAVLALTIASVLLLVAVQGANSLIITVFGEEEQPGDGCEHVLELVDRAAVA